MYCCVLKSLLKRIFLDHSSQGDEFHIISISQWYLKSCSIFCVCDELRSNAWGNICILRLKQGNQINFVHYFLWANIYKYIKTVYIVSCIYIYKYKTLLLALYVQCMLQQLKANPFMVKLQVPGKNFPEGSGFPQNFHWHARSQEHWCFALCIMEGNFYDLYKLPSGILFLVNKISNLSIISLEITGNENELLC